MVGRFCRHELVPQGVVAFTEFRDANGPDGVVLVGNLDEATNLAFRPRLKCTTKKQNIFFMSSRQVLRVQRIQADHQHHQEDFPQIYIYIAGLTWQ